MLMMVFVGIWITGIPLMVLNEMIEQHYNNKEQGQEQ